MVHWVVQTVFSYMLLIAPKGIEILLTWMICCFSWLLLIAPKGIEIGMSRRSLSM